ncbi:MAG: hypothetical protein SFW62_09810 [Alphaproteobacteria bacterium]|nr:hypothetical protein [Alphaproteobacteria bacterium]
MKNYSTTTRIMALGALLAFSTSVMADVGGMTSSAGSPGGAQGLPTQPPAPTRVNVPVAAPQATPTTNWTTENQYWRNEYSSRPYYSRSVDYSAYEPAYQYGVTAYRQNNGMPYSELDKERMRAGWDQARGSSTLTWDQAERATQDSYVRLYNSR